MSKQLAQLDTHSRKKLLELSESGMGYYVVKGYLTDDPTERTYVIAGDYFLVPETSSSLYSMMDLFEGVPFPSEATVSRALNVTGLSTLRASVSLPPGYVHALGALPLLGTITLKYPTNFYRFCTTAIDGRFVGGTLIKGTYLTTANDHGYANTGFAAVGRYALPIPVPASHLFIYQLQAGTTLLAGTVLPNYGQAGGGVEVQLQATLLATTLLHPALDDF